MSARDVIRYGTDSSGRPILMTEYMRDVWEALLRMPEVKPFASEIVIVQGAFMTRVGGGASASAGYHDLGGCLDIRVWNLSSAKLEAFIRASRKIGFPFWLRDARHGGMDSHAHGVLGTDTPLAGGAGYQWSEYIAGHDGLASRGRDYHWRPIPVVLRPPAELMQEDDMFENEDRKLLREIAKDVEANRKGSWKRDGEMRKQLVSVGKAVDVLTNLANDAKDDATREQLQTAKKQILDALAADDAGPATT